MIKYILNQWCPCTPACPADDTSSTFFRTSQQMSFSVVFPQHMLFFFVEFLSELPQFLFLFPSDLCGVLPRPFVSWLEAGSQTCSADRAHFVLQQTHDHSWLACQDYSFHSW